MPKNSFVLDIPALERQAAEHGNKFKAVIALAQAGRAARLAEEDAHCKREAAYIASLDRRRVEISTWFKNQTEASR